VILNIIIIGPGGEGDSRNTQHTSTPTHQHTENHTTRNQEPNYLIRNPLPLLLSLMQELEGQ
jgi:hypothetical protein